jgi:microcystin-dependent protein
MGSGDTDEVTLHNDNSTSTVLVNPSPPIRTTGGYDKVAISISQMPTHNHTATVPDHHHTYDDYYRDEDESVCGDPNSQAVGSDNGLGNAGGNTGDTHLTITIGDTGVNQAHENRPPYYVLSFIIKVE